MPTLLNKKNIIIKDKKPFNIEVSDKRIDVYKFKNHKYLLDLPGYKPWSVRLKYLFFMSRLVIRVSLYDSRYENNYWQQWFDYIFEENVDYVHLIYNIEDDGKTDEQRSSVPSSTKVEGKNISSKQCINIIDDIIKIYKHAEKNPDYYIKLMKNIRKKRKLLNIENTMEYMYKLISRYTDELLI
jgi:hypothetical protein